MSGLILFAETPRAGEHGHRFLVATSDQTPERQLAEFVNAVDKDVSVGANYIGVARSVEQSIGTAVRMGREIIVLAGVDVSRLNDDKRDGLVTRLRGLLARLEPLVLNGIDWSRGSRFDLVISSPELSEWLDEFQDFALPEAEWREGPRLPVPADSVKSRRSMPIGFRLALALGAILFAAAGAWYLQSPRPGTDEGVANRKSSKPFEEQDADEQDDLARVVGDLATEWDCTPEDVVRSLLRAADWGRRREAASLSLDMGLEDGQVQDLLQQLESKTGIDRLLVSPQVDSETDFLHFASTLKSSPVKTCRDVRKWLYDAWQKWDRLRQSVANAGEALAGVESRDDELARMMVLVARLQRDVGFGDEFRKPVTPLFDRQDVMSWRFLNQCRNMLEEHGINRFLGKPVASPSDSELASFLAAIRVNHAAIVAPLAVSRSQAAETVGKSQGQEAKSSVTSAFRAFEDFIEHLAGFDFE